MQEINNVFSKIKTYVQTAPRQGFVSFDSISTEARVSRAELKEHLEMLKKMKLITYSSKAPCYLTVTKLGEGTNNISAKN